MTMAVSHAPTGEALEKLRAEAHAHIRDLRARIGKLDDDDADRRPLKERFPERSFVQRLARWLAWAVPAIATATTLAYVLWGRPGAAGGGLYGAVHVLGTTMILDEGLPDRARLATLVVCVLQLPFGILVVMGSGL